MADSLERRVELEYLGLTEGEVKGMVGPFERRSREDMAEPHMHVLRLMRNPDYFYFTVKYLCGIELAPFQCVVLKEMWNRKFPMLIGSRGMGKSFILGLYAVLRALLQQGSKIVICGSGFRQAKTVFNYALNIWHNSPILQSVVADNGRSGPSLGADRWVLRLGESTVTGLPLGDGTKIRGERANCIIADEFASIDREIFETVIAGFGVVNLSPIEQAKKRARLRVLQKMNAVTDEQAAVMRHGDGGNQIIISGTAFYQFNHFCDYWRKWKGIVESKGDPKALREVFGGDPEEGFDWRHYSVIRFPVGMLPEGYMDETQVARSKATIHGGIFANEFGAVFSSDSNGFFRRSSIEACVTNQPVTPITAGAEPVQFRPALRGNAAARHVIGVDPAAQQDNFAVVVLEVHDTHRRVVHCWTTDKQRFQAKVKSHAVEEETYYAHCARKIRDLMKAFPNVEAVAIDSQGGGQNGVLEALHDTDKLRPGERPMWIVQPGHPLSDGKPRDEDDQPGDHVVELVNFAKAEYTSAANHGLKKDLEDRVLLFPMHDAVMLMEAAFEDGQRKRLFDTLEDCVDEIEELKDELTTIQYTQTPGSMRDKWDTPEVKIAGSKKGRLRKDRYSALVMANHAARRLQRQFEQPEYVAHGGFAGQIDPQSAGNADMYSFAPDWFAQQTGGDYDAYGWAAV